MGTPEGGGGTPRLGIMLAAAMFVFVIDTSFMNVSISAVVHDLDTTVSAVQAAVTTEALVSASFILISSKVGDLFGRKRAYVVGLVFYAAGALAMVVAQSVWAIIVFWAVIGGLGASLYLPAMQSLIHGNFEGKMRAKLYALVGAAGAIAAAVGAADRWLRHDGSVLAGGVPRRGSHHRGRPLRHATDPRRPVYRRPLGGLRRIVPLRGGHGRARRRRPGLAGRRGVGGGPARGRSCGVRGPGVLAPPP
jgi:hypothetical protein